MTWLLVTMWPSLLTMTPLPSCRWGLRAALFPGVMEKRERVGAVAGKRHGPGSNDAHHRRHHRPREQDALLTHGGEYVHVLGVHARPGGNRIFLGPPVVAVRIEEFLHGPPPAVKNPLPPVRPHLHQRHQQRQQQQEEQEAEKAFHGGTEKGFVVNSPARA